MGDIADDEMGRLVELLKSKLSCFSSSEGDLGLTHLGEMEIKLTNYVERQRVREKVQGCWTVASSENLSQIMQVLLC